MPHNPAKLLEDIRLCADRIQKFTAGRTLDEYRSDELVRAAVERQFMIIGEATVRLRNLAPDIFEKIDDHYGIIRFRNILIHGYEEVDDGIVWRTIQLHLPILRRQVSDLIRELEPGA